MKRTARSKTFGGAVAKRTRRRAGRRAPHPVPRRVRWLTHALAVGAGLAIGLLGARPLLDRLGAEPLRIETVSVIGHARVEAAAIAEAAGITAGASLPELDLEAIRERVTAHPWVRSARVTALPPDRVLVAIEEREPVAIARIGERERRFVDAEGVPFAPAPDGAAGAELQGVGEARDDLPHPLLRQGVALLEAWRARGLDEPASVALAGPVAAALPAVRDAQGRRVLVGPGAPEPKLVRLGRLVAAASPTARDADEIDLRFEGQVILRSEPSEDGADTDGERATGARGGATRSRNG